MRYRKLVLSFLLPLGLVGCKKAAPPEPAPASGVVPITVNENGFSPDNVTFKQGASATLRFTRTTNDTCADKVVFPDLKLEKELPLNTPVDVPITTTESRTFAFECGMGMYKSKVVVR
jgi:plastocyanin domain-containing protein